MTADVMTTPRRRNTPLQHRFCQVAGFDRNRGRV